MNTFGLRSGKLISRCVHHINRESESVHNHPNPWDYDRARVYKGVLYAEARRVCTGKPMNIARFALAGTNTSRPTFVKPGANLEWLAGPYDDKLFMFEREGGKRRFQVGEIEGSSLVKLDGTYQIGANPIARLDLIGNGLYMGHTDGQFYAVDVRTGRAFFRFKTSAKNFGPTHVVGNTLVVQAGNELLAFALPQELRP